MKLKFKRTEITDSESRATRVEYAFEEPMEYDGRFRADGLSFDELKELVAFLNGIIEEEEKKKGDRA